MAQFINYEMEYADEINNLSVFHNICEEFTSDDFGESEFFVNDQRGFSVIMDQMVEDIKSSSNH